MAQDLVRLMNALFVPGANALAKALQDEPWSPPADVYRTQDGWLVKFDLAGVRPEDLEVTAGGRRLTVRGVRRDWCVEETCCHYRMEISYSHFHRDLDLPTDLDPSRITSEYRDGMLLVRIRPPRPPEEAS
jgi:HSP20 family protein